MKRMKRLFVFLVLSLGVISCSSDDENSLTKFEFVTEYTATVTVGGVVGKMERTFEIGEVYDGRDEGGETITLRIAEHTELNEDCPNSWCYQEFLDVPRASLELAD